MRSAEVLPSHNAAWEYLKFAAGPEEQGIMAKAFGQTPTYKGQFDTWMKEAESLRGITGAKYLPDIMTYTKPLPVELTIKFSDFQRIWQNETIAGPLLDRCEGGSARDAYDRFVRDANQLLP